MFKFNITLLVITVAATTYFVVTEQYVYCLLSGLLAVVAIKGLSDVFDRFGKNILFLLNALDNGDYSFGFVQKKTSKRERELNRMLNRIKEILSKAREETIENEKFQSLIVESVSTGIIILDEKNNILVANKAANGLLAIPVLTHINQLQVIDAAYPELFGSLKAGDSKPIKVAGHSEEKQISIEVSEIKMKKGDLRIVALKNIGNELEAKEMEAWVRLIRVMTHEIMNSIAPITSLSDTLLEMHGNGIPRSCFS